jgi:hypothetical protein
MAFISINDTHRLPYENARSVTAKSVQSGNTTPLKFKNAFDDEEIGYTLKTNAKGYLCDNNGTLYTKGVYVDEDAYVTVILVNGKTTSWVVRKESDVTVNDGKLLGKVVPPSEQIPGKEYMKVGDVWRVVLHTANDEDNRTLQFGDLDNIPALNEWRETEEVYKFDENNLSYNIGEYAKTLVIQWDGSTPAHHDPIRIVLGYEINGGRHRYAQHCVVMNASPYRMTLVDRNSGATIGSVDPSGGTLNITLFFIQNENTGNWVEDEDRQLFNILDASDNSDKVTLTGAPVNGFYEVTINDRTPSTLLIEAGAITLSTVPFPGEIPIKLVAENGKLTKSKRMTLWFTNVGGGNADTLPAKIQFANTALCILQPGTLCEIVVPGLGANPGFSDNFGPVLLDTSEKATTNVCIKELTGGTQFVLPSKCQQMVLTVKGTGDSDIIFQNTQQVTRFDVANNTGSPVWFNLQATDSITQLQAVCPANQTCSFVVRNDYGKLTPMSETKSYPTNVTETNVSTYTYEARASYDIRGLATTLVVNCHAMNKEYSVAIGHHSDSRTRVYLDISSVVTDGTTHLLTADIQSFITDANQHSDDGVIIHIGSQTSDHTESAEVTHTENMQAEGERRYFFNPALVTFQAYKSGSNYNLTDKHFG